MSTQAPQFERKEIGPGEEVLLQRDQELTEAETAALAALEQVIGPEMDETYDRIIEEVKATSSESQADPATDDIEGLRKRIDLLNRGQQ